MSCDVVGQPLKQEYGTQETSVPVTNSAFLQLTFSAAASCQGLCQAWQRKLQRPEVFLFNDLEGGLPGTAI